MIGSVGRRWGAGAVVAACACLSAAGARGQTVRRDTGADRWVAVDGLGRALPGHGEVGDVKPDKTVAIFYFLWLDGKISDENGGPFDLTKILAGSPEKPAYGPPGSFHFWGEPRFGYYLNDDPFVLRKHAQMLADAGVDAVAFDVTNGPTYDDNLMALCRTFEAVRKDGGKTPKIFFLANAGAPGVVQHLYDSVYAKNLFPDLWFRWKGKPLLLAPEEGLSPEVKAFFNIRRSWAWSDPGGWFGDGKDKWTWLDNVPQQPGWHDRRDRPEQISVTVAQHPVSNIGRSFHDGKEPPPDRLQTDRGVYFDDQWKRALAVDPELVFVTGWNEWIAQRFVADHDGDPSFLGHPVKAGETFFVDQYTREFSRDIEPMKGGHGDAYYYQLAANVRRYKGVRAPLKATAPKTVSIDHDFTQWRDVGPEYLDDLGDVAHRGHAGWASRGKVVHVNESGRNDLDAAHVALDGRNVYFHVATRNPLTPAGAPGWMWLLLDLDGDHATGWEGYDAIVNRSVAGGMGSVERNVGNRWSWTRVGDAPLAHQGHDLHLAVPRALLGLKPEMGPVRFDFKWADHVPESGDVQDFIDQGDVAPNGRFNARFEGR